MQRKVHQPISHIPFFTCMLTLSNISRINNAILLNLQTGCSRFSTMYFHFFFFFILGNYGSSNNQGLCLDNLLLCSRQQKTLFSEHSSLSPASGEMSFWYHFRYLLHSIKKKLAVSKYCDIQRKNTA